MDSRATTNIPLYGIQLLLLHLNSREVAAQPSSTTVTAVNCSHSTWRKCVEALVSISTDFDPPCHNVHYRSLSLDQFLREGEQIDEGVVILNLDSTRYLMHRAHVSDCIYKLSLKPSVNVVPLCTDDEALGLLMEDLFPQLPLVLNENSPLGDFTLALSVLLQLECSNDLVEAIDVSDWEFTSRHKH